MSNAPEISPADWACADWADPIGFGLNDERHGRAYAAMMARTGWTPPEPVDPDLAEAAVFENRYYAHETIETICLQAIKRGRALAAAEAKPGLVWVKHDYSSVPPRLGPGANVATICDGGHFNATSVGAIRDWTTIEYYMWIEWPEDYEQ